LAIDPVKQQSNRVAVVGSGPAGLMAAETLAKAGVNVTIYERMPRVARKLLLAGRGGLNLTHSEPLEAFLPRYGTAEPHLRAAIEAFPPAALRAWAEELGQETFVGTSGRIFPRAMKTSPLLRAWMQRLADLGVAFAFGHRWTGWDEQGRLLFETSAGATAVEVEGAVLALGGASWPRLGADGSWTAPIEAAGVKVTSLAPANSGVRVAWSDVMRTRFAGQPLKRIALTLRGESAHDDKVHETVRGEAMISMEGLEGGAVYAQSASIRNELATKGTATLVVDLRPDASDDELKVRLAKPRGKQSLATYLRKALALDPVAIGVLQEAAHAAGTPLGALPPDDLARLIKAVPIRATAMAPIDRAISTAGGISFDDIDETFMLRPRPGTFAAGEMLDWEAPTGGYLLQACFATGRAAALGALAYLQRTDAG
jgi:uncharacterized flavoprotein (TIGR03862 family)